MLGFQPPIEDAPLLVCKVGYYIPTPPTLASLTPRRFLFGFPTGAAPIRHAAGIVATVTSRNSPCDPAHASSCLRDICYSFTMASPYKITIPMYEGPLDLLLDLIKKQEMNIHDIQISKITSQYLDYLHKLES